MKTAISIPDPIFQAAESVARRLGISRSKLYATAIAEYTTTHQQKNVTALLNEVYSDGGGNGIDGIDSNLAKMQALSMSAEEEW